MHKVNTKNITTRTFSVPDNEHSNQNYEFFFTDNMAFN